MMAISVTMMIIQNICGKVEALNISAVDFSPLTFIFLFLSPSITLVFDLTYVSVMFLTSPFNDCLSQVHFPVRPSTRSCGGQHRQGECVTIVPV